MKTLATVIRFQPVVKPVKVKAKRQRWQAVSVIDALNISLRYGFRAVVWGRW